MNIERIAKVCYAANRTYCESIGDTSQKPWDQAQQWQKDSALRGVAYALAHPGASPSEQHDAWLADRARDGWKFGPVKDPEKKEHPCFLPFSELPQEQKVKDYLFQAIVRAFVEAEN